MITGYETKIVDAAVEAYRQLKEGLDNAIVIPEFEELEKHVEEKKAIEREKPTPPPGRMIREVEKPKPWRKNE